MTEEKLSWLIYSAINDIHECCNEWYEYLHPYGSPRTVLPENYETKKRALTMRIKENLNQITEAIKEHNGG